MKARLVLEDKSIRILDMHTEETPDGLIAALPPEEIGCGAAYVDVLFDYFTAPAGSPGWFLSDNTNQGVMLTCFTNRPDSEHITDHACVPCLGWNRGEAGVLGIVTGMRLDMVTVIGVKGGVYYAYPRILLEGDIPYELIRMELHFLQAPTYAKMARIYRQHQLTKGGCVRLSERVRENPILRESADSVSVRIRQGWKPVPTPVEHQTPETEPPMHVACTFDRAKALVHGWKEAGVNHAEVCLVGWNYGGHDGRFPQIFPPDPRLGGEAALRELISETQSLGYQIVCHDDATAAYEIADCFAEEYLLKNRDGTLHSRPFCWSGGRPYKICPQRQYERFELENQPKLRELGFQGLHYIDVMTMLPLLKCYDAAHPLTRREACDFYRKIMALSRDTFGGFASEGAFDFAADLTDYALYTSYTDPLALKEAHKQLYDKAVPFWNIVYHGIVLYNPTTFTLNYPVKAPQRRLQCIELGGRPLACYYANFAGNLNWMGLEDLFCDTDAQLRESARCIRQMEEDYELLREERYLFIENHEEVSGNVFQTTYENGTVVTVDYNSLTFDIRRK